MENNLTSLEANIRETKTKSDIKKLRIDGFIPGILYGDVESKKIKTKEITSLKGVLQLSMLSDWLILEIIEQSGIRNADISGMTGNLEYQRGSCTKRSIPMQMIHSAWITS